MSVPLSPAFRKKATVAVFMVVIFGLVYFLMFLLSLGALAGLSYIGAMLVLAKPHFITLALGIGLLIAGIFIVVFMVKSLFSIKVKDDHKMMELDLESEPELKALIVSLTSEIQTKLPKKVYLTHAVNASVFYESSFWSMFFPVRKNLMIGVGLVNGVTVSEFKGILAHEFGHSSQRSMAVGSYVNNVNKLIHNMLYDNEGYQNAMNSWMGNNNYFRIASWLAVVYNGGVQYILRQLYVLVNKGHFALSREMEFHADAIGASVVGPQPMIDSLLRMDLVSQSFDNVVDHYNGRISENIKPDNIFSRHSFALGFTGKQRRLDFNNGFPHLSPEQALVKSRLRVEDLWASHPGHDERIASISAFGHSEKSTDQRPAGTLFRDFEQTQKDVTAYLFTVVAYESATSSDALSDFEKAYSDVFQSSFPDVFNGYYDNHNPLSVDVSDEREGEFQDFFGPDSLALIKESMVLQQDISLLDFMTANSDAYRNFEFDGGRYKSDKAALVSEILGKKLMEIKAAIQENDQMAFRYFRTKASQKGTVDALTDAYREFFENDGEYDAYVLPLQAMHEAFLFAYETRKYEEIHRELKAFLVVEDDFRKALEKMMSDEKFRNFLTDETTEILQSYLTERPVYFDGQSYDDEAIGKKDMAMYWYRWMMQEAYLSAKKRLLSLQENLM